MVANWRRIADNEPMRIRYALLASSLLACTSPTDPLTQSGLPRSTAQAIVGTWALQSWNAKPMPATYSTYLGLCSIEECSLQPDSLDRIASGSVTLSDDATFLRIAQWEIVRMDGTVQRTYTTTEQGSYTGSVAGGHVTLNLYGAVRMQIAVSGNVMSAKYAIDQTGCGQPTCPPVVLGDVWRYVK